MTFKTSHIVISFTVVSLAFLFFILWLVDFSGAKISEEIPGTGLRTYGLLILLLFIGLFIFFQSIILRRNRATPITSLVLLSTIVAFSSLFPYQLIRNSIILGKGFPEFLFSAFVSSAVPTIVLILLALSISVELKKIKGIWQHLPSVALLLLLFFAKKYIHHIDL